MLCIWGAVYESTAATRTVIPGEQVHHQHHHEEPKVVVVSTGTGADQTVGNDYSAARTFAREEGKAGQGKVNLQKPIVNLEEDPAAPRSTQKYHAASNYQSKVTDPTGAGMKHKLMHGTLPLIALPFTTSSSN